MFESIKTYSQLFNFHPKREIIAKELNEFTKWIAEDFLHVFLCEILVIWENNTRDLFWENFSNFNKDGSKYSGQPIDQGYFGHVKRTKKPLLVRNLKSDIRMRVNEFDKSVIESNYYSERYVSEVELVIPLIDLGNVIGLINVESKDNNSIHIDEARVISSNAKWIANILKHFPHSNDLAIQLNVLSAIFGEKRVMLKCFKNDGICSILDIHIHPDQVFIGMPFNAEYDEIYRQLINPVIERHMMKPWRADSKYEGKDLMHNICQGIQESPVCIFEVSNWNSNVMFELGMACAMNKIIILIKSSESQNVIPADLRNMIYVNYHVDQIEELGNKLDTILSKIEPLSRLVAGISDGDVNAF